MQTFFVLEDQRGVREGQGKGKTRRGKEICQGQYGGACIAFVSTDFSEPCD